MSTGVTATPKEFDPKKSQNPLKALNAFGQSVWLDYIRRNLISTGELARLIEQDGLRGVTSNPSIFEKAITGSTDYTKALEKLSAQKNLDAKQVYEALAIRDIQDAADVLRPVYDQTHRRDGYVSLEVAPYLAHKTQETIDEARRLWKAVGRENLMVKVPGTPEGIPAIQQVISEGININVTLLFAQDVYERVAEAYIAGLEAFAKSGGKVGHIGSVASFFVSRIDTLIDSQIADRIKKSQNPSEQAALRDLVGKVAIANAKLTYQRYKKLFSGPRWAALASHGRANATGTVGQHEHEESQVFGCSVRGRTDRAGHGGHDSSGHLRRVSRPRKTAREPRREYSRRPADHGLTRARRNLDESSHRPTDRRRRETFLRSFRQASRSRGYPRG